MEKKTSIEKKFPSFTHHSNFNEKITTLIENAFEFF
jgi:hypothetical protein